ncbi:MAG: phage tail tip lysozyme [archaeon]|nr:phage tail tip lysozyme [archaeon]
MGKKEEYFDYLKNKNLRVATVSGILANISKESSYNSKAVGDGGLSFGLCQWYKTRKDKLIKYASDRNLDYQDAYVQLDFMIYELTNDYKQTWEFIKTVPNTKQGAYDSAYKFCKYYEIPADTINRAKERGNLAMNLFQEFYNTSTVTKKLSNEEMADEVISGKYGNGETRKQMLTALGYNYQDIQNIVNEKLGINNKRQINLDDVANKVIFGFYGNGEDRKINLARDGYNYDEVQDLVNKKLRGY